MNSVLQYIFLVLFSCYYVVILSLRAVIVWLFKRGSPDSTRRTEKPACLTDPSIGKHGFVELKTRGIKIHYVANGCRSKPLMLFLHGFPEFWYMWKNQLTEFGKDYFAVAMDMIGYGESSIPLDVTRYSREELCADVKEFVLEMGYTSCILVAHDWGAVVAFATAAEYPDVVDKLIAMNVPHPRGYEDKFSWGQLLRSSYIFFFQLPYIPEYLLSAMDYTSLDNILQKGTKSNYFTDEEIEAYKYTFHKSGFTGPLNYYRSVMIPSKFGRGNIAMPSILIWGTEDIALGVELAEASGKYLDNGKVVYIDGASHFVNADEPDLVHKHMKDFLSNE